MKTKLTLFLIVLSLASTKVFAQGINPLENSPLDPNTIIDITPGYAYSIYNPGALKYLGVDSQGRLTYLDTPDNTAGWFLLENGNFHQLKNIASGQYLNIQGLNHVSSPLDSSSFIQIFFANPLGNFCFGNNDLTAFLSGGSTGLSTSQLCDEAQFWRFVRFGKRLPAITIEDEKVCIHTTVNGINYYLGTDGVVPTLFTSCGSIYTHWNLGINLGKPFIQSFINGQYLGFGKGDSLILSDTLTDTNLFDQLVYSKINFQDQGYYIAGSKHIRYLGVDINNGAIAARFDNSNLWYFTPANLGDGKVITSLPENNKVYCILSSQEKYLGFRINAIKAIPHCRTPDGQWRITVSGNQYALQSMVTKTYLTADLGLSSSTNYVQISSVTNSPGSFFINLATNRYLQMKDVNNGFAVGYSATQLEWEQWKFIEVPDL